MPEPAASARLDVTTASREELVNEVRSLRRSLSLTVFTLEGKMTLAQAAIIADRQKPGEGMLWICNDVIEDGCYPGPEGERGWDGVEPAQSWHNRIREQDRNRYRARELRDREEEKRPL